MDSPLVCAWDESFGDLHFLTGGFVTKRQVIGAKGSIQLLHRLHSVAQAATKPEATSSESELQSQCELSRAWSANLIKRIQTAKTSPQHHERLAKECADGEVVFGISKIRMVEDVEELCTKLKSPRFGQCESSMKSEVELSDREAA